jgi:two-component system response regulator AtoC
MAVDLCERLNQQLSGKKVLLIEDNETVLRALHTAFDYSGCIVTAVATAEEGLIEIDREMFDLIVCDYRLPGKNGAQFFSDTESHTKHSVKILISAYGFSDFSDNEKDIGIDAFFEKPFSVQELIRCVHAIENGAYNSSS